MSVKKLLKRLIFQFLPARLCLAWLARRHCIIFFYHRFAEVSAPSRVSAQAFTAHLNALLEGFQVLPLSEFCRQRRAGRKDWRRCCVITVDDGYRDFYEVAYPELRQRGFPATLFVTTGFLNGDTWLWWDVLRYILDETFLPSITVEHAGQKIVLDLTSPETRCASWDRLATLCTTVSPSVCRRLIDSLSTALGVPIPPTPPSIYQPCSKGELSEMAKHGVSIAPHSVNHPILTLCEPDEWKREIMDSRAHLVTLGPSYVDIFAYPNGTPADYNPPIEHFLESTGVRAAVVAHYDAFDQETHFSLRRCTAPEDLDEFRWKLWGGEYVLTGLRERLRRTFSRLSRRSPIQCASSLGQPGDTYTRPTQLIP